MKPIAMILVTMATLAAAAAGASEHPATTRATTQPTAVAPAAQPRGAAATGTGRDPLGDLPSYGQMLRRTAYTLFAIIAALLIAAKVLPRWLGKVPLAARGKTIEVVEFHRLEPRKGIYLIRVAGQYFLVGSTGDRLETLAGGPLDQEKIAAALGAKGVAKRQSAGAIEMPPAGAAGQEKRSFVEVLRGKRTGDEIER